jgi:hypothetical protein
VFGYVPEPHSVVIPGRQGEDAAIGRERHGAQRQGLGVEARSPLAPVYSPEPEHAVVTGSGEK